MLGFILFLVDIVSISPEKLKRIMVKLDLRVDRSHGLRTAIVNALNDDLDTFEGGI